MLLGAGVRDVIPVDRSGALNRTDRYENPHWRWLAEHCNRENRRGSLRDVLEGADVFIGVSAPGILQPERHRAHGARSDRVRDGEPDPGDHARRRGARRRRHGDRPLRLSRIRSTTCWRFPGIFRGALDVRARRITEGMKLAAAYAIAEIVGENELSAEYVIPSVFDTRVVDAVAKAVAAAAVEDGVARRAARDWRRRRSQRKRLSLPGDSSSNR